MFDWNSFHMGSYPMMANLLFPLILWSLVWKGLTLWTVARRGQAGWFIFFLIFNTAGVVEIIYLLLTGGFDELASREQVKK